MRCGLSVDVRAEESSAGCVLVVDNAELVGILTEQDVVKLLGERQHLATLVVADVMTRKVITLSASDRINPAAAIGRMVACQIHHLPVVDDSGHILGLLTQAQLRQLFDTADFMKARQVREAMDSGVVHALPTDLIAHVIERMAQQHAGYILISQSVTGKHKRLRPLGIITTRDIVQFKALALDPQRIQAQTVMSFPLFTAKPVDTLWTVDRRMRQHRVQQLVVVSEQDEFLGVVAQNGLLPEEIVDDVVYSANSGINKRNHGADEVDIQGIEMNLDGEKRSPNQDQRSSANADIARLRENIYIEGSDIKTTSDKERFFSLSLDLFCVADLEGRFTQVNDAFETTLGHSKEDFVTQPYLNFVHPDDRAATKAEIDRLAKGDCTIAFENRYRCLDGSYKWLLWNVKPDSEKPVLYGVARDITERKKAESLLRLRAVQQAAIAQFGQLALATEDMSELMNHCVAETARGLGVEYCKILEHLPEEGVLRLKAGVGWKEGLVGRATVEGNEQSQASYTLASQKPVIVDDLRSETRFPPATLLLEHKVISGISTLVRGQQRPYGTLGVHTKAHRIFSEDDVNFVRSMANILASGIERYRTECSMQQQLDAVEAAVEGIAILRGDRFISLNQAHVALFGYQRAEELIGKTWRCLYSPEEIARFEQDVFPVLAREGAWQGEVTAVRKDGSTFAEGLSLTLSEDGLLICVCRDISDRKQAERSLQQSEAVLRSFFHSTPLMMGVVEVRDDDIIHISDNAVTAGLFHLTSEAMRHRSAKDMGLPANIIRMWIGYYRQAAITGEPVRFEYLHNAGDADCWLSATVATIVDGESTEPTSRVPSQITADQSLDGQRFAYVVEDTTERKRIEAKLQEQASLLDVATDAILVRGVDGRIAYWNKGAELLYGWTEEEAIGQVADRLLYLDDSVEEESDANNEKIYQSLKATGRWRGECLQVTKFGQIVTVMSRWTQVSDFRGQPSSILTVNTDITQAKQLEVQFLRAQRLESIGTLASGIAHDLNNILTPIYGVAHLLPLQLPNANEKMMQQFKILQDSAKRGSEIIRQVLSFSRGMEGDRVPVAIKHVIAEIKSFVHKTFPKSIEIAVDIPKDLQMVIGDVTQLHQVFMNFFVNARDAMPSGGCISLSATNLQIDEAFVASHIEARVGPYILVTVADTGMGIAPEQLDRIFEPFFTTKQNKGGTGLGLSTAHGIVKSHGGFITVYSEVGKGTQFNVYLPAVENTEVAIVEAAEYPAGNGECILIVDDEAPIREVARSVLENYHYQVLVAEDGIDAIAQYTKNYVHYVEHADADSHTPPKDRIRAVLMDMTMPNLGGAKTIEVLHKIDPQLVIIAVSGLPGNQQIAASINGAVKAFVQKPYSSTTLLKTLRDVIHTNRCDRDES